MSADSSYIPETPPSPRAAHPPDPWCDATKTLIERAATLREGRPARVRVILFQTLVAEMPMRRASTPPDAPSLADLFEAAFGDPTGREFWHLRLQSWVDPGQFAQMLATFLALDGQDKDTHKFAVGMLLAGDLTAAGVIPRTVQKAYSLDGDSFDPLIPLRWMAKRELFHDWLPLSLRAYLLDQQAAVMAPEHSPPLLLARKKGSSAPTPALQRRRGPTPEVGPRVEAEMRRAIRDGLDLGGMKQSEMEARFKAAASTCRTIRNIILGETGDDSNSA